MHPSWFLDHQRRGRRSPSFETQFRDPSYPSPDSFQGDDDVPIPSYMKACSTDTLPSAMGNVLIGNDHSHYECPLEASGLDFSAYDPEGMAYLDAISSRSRNSEEEQEYRQKEQQGQERIEKYDQEDDRLIDIEENHGDTPYPLPSSSSEIQQYADFDPFSPITQSQLRSHSQSQSDTISQQHTRNDQNHGRAHNRYQHTSQIVDTISHLANERSKRKYGDEYEGGEHDYAGPSTQMGWKRQRAEASSPEEEEEEVEVWQDRQASRIDHAHNCTPVSHDWLIPPPNPEVSSLAMDGLRGGQSDEEDIGAQTSRSNSEMEDDVWRSDALTVVNEKHVDWQGEEMVGGLDQHQTQHSRESSDEAMDQEGEVATESVPVSEDGRTVLAEEKHQEPTIPATAVVNESHPISQETGNLVESRKRSAEEHRTTPSPTRKKSRRPTAPKIVLAKALPKVVPNVLPPANVPTSPPSSPTRPKPKNATLGMMPRRNFNSAPNRASTSKSTSTSIAARQIVTDQGPVEFFASLKASKEPVKVKQKAFKSPLPSGRGGITLKPKDPNQSSINYGQSTDQHHISIPTSIPAQIAILEKEAQKLRQALKYQTQSEDDDRLQDLIIQWRTAGRDVVEQIYDRVPKPTESEEQADVKGRSNPWMMGSDTGPQLTEEQERWLRDCPKNEDGEPVDDEGNTVIPEPQDLKTLIEHESRPIRGEKEGYFPRYEHDGRGKSKQVTSEAREWNMGTMMLKMSVDPTLLGWDDDLEDWIDSESL